MVTTADAAAAGGPFGPARAGPGQAQSQARDSILAWRRPGPLGRLAAADPVFVATLLAELILAIGAHDSSPAGDEAIRSVITDAATSMIPGADEAGLELVGTGDHPDRRGRDLMATNVELVMKAEDHAAEGPCRAAAATGHQVMVHDLHTDNRWPRFAGRTPWAVNSVLCTPLASAAGPHVLLVLSTRAWAFDDTSARLAKVLAAHAALAVGHAEHTRNLHAMAEGRDIIGQAKGILMQRHQLTAEQAYQALTQASNNSNIKLRTVCQHLADTGRLPPTQHGTESDTGEVPTSGPATR